MNKIAQPHCNKSIQMLTQRCNMFFSRFKDTRPVYLDSVENSAELMKDPHSVDIVFFGSIIQKAFQLPRCNFKKARFWCLSSTNKDILTEVFKLPRECISIINREELFPEPLVVKPLRPRDITHFVYAGRISPPKNIIALLHLVSKLQIKFNLNTKLSLYGSFDDEQNFDERPQFRKSYKDQVFDVIESLDWNCRPVFFDETSELDWPHRVEESSVFINLSKYLQEDFGVSLAQWQELGRASIISNWGGHRDIQSENVLKVPPHLIPERDEPSHIVDLKIDRLADLIFNSIKPVFDIPLQKGETSLPEYCSRDKSIKGILEVKAKLGHLYPYIDQGKWGLFSSTHCGQNFLNEIKIHFNKQRIRKVDASIICNWFECNEREETLHVKENIQINSSHLKDPEFIYFRDIHLSENIRKLLLSKSIIFPYFIPEMMDSIRAICKDSDAYPPLIIILNPKQQRLFTELSAYVRQYDQILF